MRKERVVEHDLGDIKDLEYPIRIKHTLERNIVKTKTTNDYLLHCLVDLILCFEISLLQMV